ncbi:MAG TPA: tetratricopeptide repeat protein [Planctomycetaceae bacterium]
MPIQRQRFILALVSVACVSSPAFGIDEVVRQSGGSVRGTITSTSKTELSVEAAGQTTAVPVTDVAAVRWDGEPPQLNLTRTREANGDLEFALGSYRELLGQVPADKRDLRTDLQFLIARTLARQAVADPGKKDTALKALNDYVSAHGDSFRFYEALQWVGRVHAAAGEADAAKAAYARVAEAPLPELKMAAQNAVARIKLDQGDLAGALADFDAVLSQQADSPAASSQRFSAELGKAVVLQRQGNHDEALKTLDEVIARASPDDAAVQAEAFLRKGDSLQATGNDKDALLAYLHVDILFPGESGPHAEALYHLAKLWATAGKPDRSAEARRKLTEQYPASEWASKL